MKTAYTRSASHNIPGYSQNAALQLIAISGVGYVAYLFVAVCFQAFGHYRFEEAVAVIKPNIAIAPVHFYLHKWWTLFTYGWSHDGFWDWLSSMVWLYCFGSILQSMIGYRQIIPLFFMGLLGGGVFFLLVQLIPGASFNMGYYFLGAQAGVMALAAACITVAPRYKVFLGPNLSIPILVFAGLFTMLMLLRISANLPLICLLLGGAAVGFGYIKMLQSGLQPSEWIYNTISKIGNSLEPGAKPAKVKVSTHGVTQHTIDELLDKISMYGVSSLSKEERELLMSAGQDNNNNRR